MNTRRLGRRFAVLEAVLGDLYGVCRTHGVAQGVLFVTVVVWFWGAIRLVGAEDKPYSGSL